MADIKSYLKEKEKREKNQSDYKNKIHRHRMSSLYRLLLVIAVIATAIALVLLQYKRHIYTGYDIVSSIERSSVSDATDIRFDDSILTYSKDGAHCTDVKGNVKWNQTYEIQDIEIDINQDVVAIGSYNGREIYVNDTSGQLGTITTTMPIRRLAVSTTGYVTAVLADTSVTWVNTYSPEGELIYSASTTMSNSGYPAAIDLSPNGELLAIAYVYVDAGSLKTNVSFYNFGPVGDNQNDYFVGVYTYTDLLVPDIRFLDNETVAAIGDSRLMIYKGRQKPVLEAEYLFDSEIKSVFSDSGYVGIVFLADDSEHKYCINVYDTSAQKVGSYYFDIDYTDIYFDKNNFVIYNESECVIMTYDNIEKFNGEFSKTVNTIIPSGSAYKYTLVTDEAIDIIQMK
ncbi:MAG: DUF5711 family protein [Lachnospiraceae bacterium]|nr:DUF5711 family protein [Lachnospiraceae bacterium]